MVEQWSSKSHVWVRFLLPLLRNFHFNKNFVINKKRRKKKIINFLKLNKKNNLRSNYFYYPNEYLFVFRKNKNKNKNNHVNGNSSFNKNLILKYALKSNTFIYYNTYLEKSTFFFTFFNLFKDNNLNNVFKANNLTNLYFYFINNAFINRVKLEFYSNFTQSDNLNKFSKNISKKLYYFNFNRFISIKSISSNLSLFFFKFFSYKKNKSCLPISVNLLFKNNKFRFPTFTNLLFKYFFKNFKFNDKIFNIFFLKRYDWINNSMARLTNSSFRLNFNDYFDVKNFLYSGNKLVSFLNFNKINNKFHENSYYLIFNNTKNNKPFSDIFFNYGIKLNFNKFFYNYKAKFNNENKLLNNFNIFNKFEFLLVFHFKPIFFKYLSFNDSKINKLKIKKIKTPNLLKLLKDFFFYSEKNIPYVNNIVPNPSFSYIIKKKMLKVFNYSKFTTSVGMWYHSSLIKFLEFSTGKKVLVKFFSFLINKLNFNEKAQCLIWAQKVKYFRKVLGPRLFLNESLQIMYLSLKLKDPFILSNWISSTMKKISFWKYKTFLRYIKYVLRYFFWVIYKDLNMKGVKFQLKGKISVAGNARTRTVFHNVGFTSHTTFNNKILYHLNLVKSFTGVMGLKLWLVF